MHIQISSVLAGLIDAPEAKISEEKISEMISYDKTVEPWSKLAEIIIQHPELFRDFIT